MRATKLPRRAGFAQLPRCYDVAEELRGRWREAHGFPPDAQLIVELAAGRADFAIGLAQLHPDALVIAVDAKSERLWAGAHRAAAEGSHNVCFLRHEIGLLALAFAPGEVSRIWITFPDPFPKVRHARRRLTAQSFWPLYRQLVAPGGRIELKTDDEAMFQFSLEQMEASGLRAAEVISDVYASGLPAPEVGILTAYERRFLAEGRKTQYFRVELPTSNRGAI
jgi:tRNA (guanine-N7-)-methyltransferase